MNPADPIALFRTRRSHRRFLDEPLNPEHIKALQDVALWSPTAMNRRDTRFIFVTRRETLTDLSSRLPNAHFLGTSGLAVAVMGRQQGVAPAEDCSIAAISVQLAAHALGLGSCWAHVPHMTGRDGKSAAENVAEVLDIPDDYFVQCIIGIGKPDPTEPGMPCGDRPVDRTRVSEVN